MAAVNYKNWEHQITQDLFALENSIAKVKEQVKSLAEVVLQHGRALDLLYAEQEGYCMASGKPAASMWIT